MVGTPRPFTDTPPTSRVTHATLVRKPHYGCHYYPLTYSVDPSPSPDWSLDIDIYDPSGNSADSEFEYGTGPVTATVDEALFLCSEDLTGTYTVKWELTAYGNGSTTVTGSDTFVISPSETRTQLSVSDKTLAVGQVVRFKIKAKVQKPNGFFGTYGLRVVLERKRNGQWQRIPGSRSETDTAGKVVLKYRWVETSTPGKVRARTLPEAGSYLGSTSTAVYVRGAR
jgi:hypothetical protein